MVHTKNPSPAWVNPADVGKRFRLKRNASRAFDNNRAQSSSALPSSSTTSKSPAKAGRSPAKIAGTKSPGKSPRKPHANPFTKRCTPSKRQKIGSPSPKKLLRSSEKSSVAFFESPKSSRSQRVLNLNSDSQQNFRPPVDFSSLFAEIRTSSSPASRLKAPEPVKKTLHDMPLDLRPGLRLRISSLVPFPWIRHGVVSSATPVIFSREDEVAARETVRTANFERPGPFNGLKSPMAQLGSLAHYYAYPNISAFKLPIFPRFDLQVRPQIGLKSLQQIGSQFCDGLSAEWKITFETLFMDWRRHSIDSFFVFAHNTTFYFTKHLSLNTSLDTTTTTDGSAANCGDETLWALSGQPKHRVVITPTTSGLRQLLTEEGIDFTCPLVRKVPESSPETEKVDLEENADDDKENDDDDVFEAPTVDDHDTWLKQIGISPRSTLGFRKYATISDLSLHSTLSNTAYDDVEEHNMSLEGNEAAKSTLVITCPGSIHALFNLISSSKEFRSTTGLQGGLPPSLIAVRPFLNASLKRLSITSHIIKRHNRGGKLEYILELDGGPILSHVPEAVVSVLRSMPQMATKNNQLNVTVVGRQPYVGLNEAIDPAIYSNHSEMEFDFTQNVFKV